MSSNPYQAPAAPLADRVPVKPRPVLGIVVGALIDLLGTTGFGIVVGAGYAVYFMTQGMDPEVVGARMAEDFGPTAPLGIAMMLVGLLISSLAGYVCARMAKRSEYRYAAILSVISVSFGLLVGGAQHGWAFNGLMIVLTVSAILLGARFGLGKNRQLAA